jgi:hypothetical protein
LSHSLQIRTRGWHFTNVNYFTRSGYGKKFFLFPKTNKQNEIYNIISPFNLVVNSEMADFALLNSVLAEAKFVVVVSKLSKVAEPYHSITFKQFMFI